MDETSLILAVRCLWWISIAASVLLCLRLLQTRLYRRYRLFFGFLAFTSARGLLLASVPFNRNIYAHIWMLTQPVLWLLYVLVVIELSTLVLEKFRGLATLGRWLLAAGLILAFVVSSYTVSQDLSVTARYPWLLRWTAIERAVHSSVVVFLLLITAVMAWYPIPLSRNVILHCALYAVYFLSAAGIYLVHSVAETDAPRHVANLALTSVTVVCFAVWIVYLNRRGEEITISRRVQWSGQDESQVISQLAAINATLLRAARK